MAIECYKRNIAFLKKRMIHLSESGCMFSPYEYEDALHRLDVDEYQNMTIRNKKTGHMKIVNLVTHILEDSDLDV